MKKLIIAGILLKTIFSYGVDGNYIIKSEGFRNDKGNAIISLYRQGESMKKDGFINLKAEIKEGKCRFDIKSLKPGKYALRVIHDENKNGKMDMGFIGTEGIGVSRNIKVNKVPKFEEVNIDFNSKNSEIFVKVQYPTIFDFIKGGMKHGE